MQKDIHYYAILAYCRACGFNKVSAQEIAFASQYVDDARINFIELAPKERGTKQAAESHKPWKNMATCHHYFKPATYNFDAMLNNTCAFHFVPGCEGKTLVEKMVCKKGTESPVLAALVRDAIDCGDRIALGVVLHAYADSFSHQGFSGLLSKVNLVDSIPAKGKRRRNFNRWAASVPGVRPVIHWLRVAYGHGPVFKMPDRPYGTWYCGRDVSDDFSGEWQEESIDNAPRYLEAFENIERILGQYLTKHPEERDTDVPTVDFEVLRTALTKKGIRLRRIREWNRVIRRIGLFAKSEIPGLKYDKTSWLKTAFANYGWWRFRGRKVKGAVVIERGFDKTAWNRFREAVHWYKGQIYHHCSQSGLELYGLTVPPDRKPDDGSGAVSAEAA